MNPLRPAGGFSTFVELLSHRAAFQGDRTAFVYLEEGERPAEPWSYAELDCRARAVAARLQADGLAGSRALLLYPAGLDFVAAFLGCLHAGVTAVPLAPPGPARLAQALPRIEAVIADAEPSLLLANSKVVEAWEALGAKTPAKLRALATDDIGRSNADDWQEPDVGPNSIAMLQYTSGSTGAPKGVVLTHRNLLDQTAIIRELFGFSDEDRGCSWLPVYHDMGLIGMILQPIDTCSPVTLMSPVPFLQRPLRWLRAISDFRATYTTAPNFAYELCVRKAAPGDLENLDLSCWRQALVGAEPVREGTLRRFHEAFAPAGFRWETFRPCYGLAETTLAVSGAGKGQGPHVVSVDAAALEQGRVVPDDQGPTLVSAGGISDAFEVAIVDPQSLKRCPPDEVGEVWVKGGSVAAGYWRRADVDTFAAQPLDSDSGPFLRTGDLGFVQDGELFITGRLKDMVILGGRNLYPQDLEATAASAHTAVRPGCAVAFAVEGQTEEKLVIVVEIEDRRRHPCDPAQVIKAIRRAISDHHDANAWDVALAAPGTIYKTSSGKVQRHACKAAYCAGEWEFIARLRRPAGSPESQPVIENFLIHRLADALEVMPDAIDPDESFANYGLDSRTSVALAAEFENRFGRKLPATLLWDHPSVTRLASYLAAYSEVA
jgi:acyl-CoA synthetase (AMP-forming)/AMP-acid ligase II/acyl carrier protein